MYNNNNNNNIFRLIIKLDTNAEWYSQYEPMIASYYRSRI